jgi:hypothetical protein
VNGLNQVQRSVNQVWPQGRLIPHQPPELVVRGEKRGLGQTPFPALLVADMGEKFIRKVAYVLK